VARWRRALHDGVAAGTAAAAAAVTVKVDPAALAAGPVTGTEVTFGADPHAFDGRHANNSWLLELPDPLTKLTWDNAALMSLAMARRLGVADGDAVNLTVGGRTERLPALVAAGQAEDSIALTVGLGRKRAGQVAAGAGFNTYPLRATSGWGFAAATVARAPGKYVLAITQEHFAMEGRDLVRDTPLAKLGARKPGGEGHGEGAGHGAGHAPKGHHAQISMFPDFKYEGHKWGLVIDLNTCIGCNACTVACQSENNILNVGKEGVLRSREMHWIRLDRYFEGPPADPVAVAQPMACQQCEHAPCEQVCPVGATTHSPEGLNDMTYNRCIGTKYCGNNCPFKVRRFNFFHYAEELTELKKLQHNPDVTVRSRGVMEKCTYCVQRINQAKIAAHADGKERVVDGAILTACQQTCPTQAITFGDLNDPKSLVTRRAAEARTYTLLEELNVRPRTSYLDRVRNLNPELA
jgi:molybdopterin-containing oxidoreductase family iron-sulfur binding subunit